MIPNCLFFARWLGYMYLGTRPRLSLHEAHGYYYIKYKLPPKMFTKSRVQCFKLTLAKKKRIGLLSKDKLIITFREQNYCDK